MQMNSRASSGKHIRPTVDKTILGKVHWSTINANYCQIKTMQSCIHIDAFILEHDYCCVPIVDILGRRLLTYHLALDEEDEPRRVIFRIEFWHAGHLLLSCCALTTVWHVATLALRRHDHKSLVASETIQETYKCAVASCVHSLINTRASRVAQVRTW